ncbi:MIP/aquaporin family protein [Entomobacter blattae]|uniref:Aquaporin Z n=1 Tax=Entomobacter blattae TaxID=2762277 RepID=A0A7H1NR13_9PROT|nr:aquaporin [Entomobacter blattae]QNT78223.1 Aquaporin Z [Entomobacter blattae]
MMTPSKNNPDPFSVPSSTTPPKAPFKTPAKSEPSSGLPENPPSASLKKGSHSRYRWADRFLYPYINDRPLAGEPRSDRPYHPRLYACEFAATTILMLFGICSNVIIGSPYSPISHFLSQTPTLQVALEGLLFGFGGTLGAISPFGRVSGGHLNPSVSLAFMISSKLVWRDMLGYMAAQITGATFATFLVVFLGMLWPLWGLWASSLHYSATIPNPHFPIGIPLLGEICATACLIIMIFYFGSRTNSFYQKLTPWLVGPLYFMINPFEAWFSGDSTNLARSFGPALASAQWYQFWIYVIGPFIGAALVPLLLKASSFGILKIREARITNFGHRGYAPYLIPPEIPLHHLHPLPPQQASTTLAEHPTPLEEK